MVEPLTEREREVLVHVSGMLNTAEVASEMYISVNTVKTHLKNIYRKLAAAHRSEAVRRARQLKLIFTFAAGMGWPPPDLPGAARPNSPAMSGAHRAVTRNSRSLAV